MNNRIINNSNKIVIVIYRLGYGGAERVFKSLIGELNDYQVKIYCKDKLELKGISSDFEIVQFKGMVDLSKKIKESRVLFFGYPLAALVTTLRIIMFKTSIDSIVRHTAYYETRISSLDLRYGFIKGLALFAFYNFGRFLFPVFYMHIAQNQGMKNNLIDKFSIKERRIVVIENPIPELFFNQTKPDKSLLKKILFVGRLIESKGIFDLMKVIDLVSISSELIIAGDGYLKKDLIHWINNRNGLVNVKYIGNVDNIQDYYSKSDLTILTSYEEGSPNVLLESIASGTPVIAYDCNVGPSEIILDSINGFLINLGDIKDFGQKIDLALNFQWDVNKIKSSVYNHKTNNIVPKYIDLFRDAR